MTIPSNSRFSFLLSITIFLSVASAQIYDISIPPQGNDSYEYADFRIVINDSLETIRGVYFFMHPWHGDSRNIVNDDMLKALCDSSGFALMGAHFDNMHMETGVGDAVIDAMNGFVEMTGRSELSFAPFFINGYSWGGQFAYHYTIWNPDRVIGFITQKGGYHDTTDAGDAISVPGLMFIGEEDLDYRITNLTRIFLDHRPFGAKWSLAVEQGAGHSQVLDWDFLNSFFIKSIELRLPDSAHSSHPVDLLSLPDSIAWFGDQSIWKIGSYECFDGIVDSSSWFPSRNVGDGWQNFVSEGVVEDTSECDNLNTKPYRPHYTFALKKPFPNPFNPTTTIRFNAPVETRLTASLRIFDITGRLVETLVDGKMELGNHEIIWNASNQSSGIYFVVLHSKNIIQSQKLILLK